ncbi:WecB/TagA/CpsF family glycosyltransferase [Terribacillus saccharophilus]|nr:WecB/TagA/CpsF family glycosyltransferase [Terribacillus saccharophilus]
MPNEHIKIMDIPFVNITQRDLLKGELYPRLQESKTSYIVTANPEIVMYAKEDKSYKEAILTADYIIPDGAGIVIASKVLKKPLKERVTGFDLMIKLLSHAEGNNLSCYFLGAKEEVVQEAMKRVKRDYPELKIAGHHHGYFDLEDASIAERVKEANPDIVFAALGFPKQELWINKYMSGFKKGLFMGVGGSFDILAGNTKRAPYFWIKLNLEWLYRLLKEPFRWKRILKVFEFIFRIILFRK